MVAESSKDVLTLYLCRSRLDLMQSIKDLADQVRKAEEGAEKRTAQAMDVENQLNTIMTEMQHLEPKQRFIRSACPHTACHMLAMFCAIEETRLVVVTEVSKGKE